MIVWFDWKDRKPPKRKPYNLIHDAFRMPESDDDYRKRMNDRKRARRARR